MANEKTARWREITDFLRGDVLEEYYQPGQALPGEAVLADHYATSRPTIRKAIAQLVGEGLLTVAHGRGTFVRPRAERRLILIGQSTHADFLSPAHEMISNGWESVSVPSDAQREGVNHLEPQLTAPGSDDATVLRIGKGRSVVLRFTYWQSTSNRVRIALHSTVIADLVGTVAGQGRERTASLDVEPADYYSHLEKTHGPLRWTTTAHSAMPYGGLTEDLEMESTGTPLLVVRRIMHSHDGRPLEYTEIQAPGDRFEAAATVEGDADADGYVALRV